MRIGIANDHNGVSLKKKLIKFLTELGYETKNYGTDTEVSVDYPLYAFKVGEAINNQEIDLGILICHTGIGMSIAANKIKNVRCAKVDNIEEAFMTRSHNDSNILALSDSKSIDEIKEIVKTFIETPFSKEERHMRRIDLINNYNEY